MVTYENSRNNDVSTLSLLFIDYIKIDEQQRKTPGL